VTGFITAELFAASSAVDTDFTVMLVDVDPSGYARFLTDGITRARYRNSTDRAEEIVPGRVYKYTIDLWATSNVFKAGHRIRVYVSSSNFPRFNRNLNTGEPTLGSRRMVTAKQTVYHDPARPSSITLPVVPRPSRSPVRAAREAPPSTTRIAPLRKLAASEARKIAAPASSSTLPNLPAGVRT
jgi:putative CocE/NonD family hydrolase